MVRGSLKLFFKNPLYNIFLFRFLLAFVMGSILFAYFYLVIIYWPYFRTIEIFSANETKYLFIYLIATFLTYSFEVGCFVTYTNVAAYVLEKLSEEEILQYSKKKHGTITQVRLTRSGDFIIYLHKTGRKISSVRLFGKYDMLPELYSKLNINEVLGIKDSWYPEGELARLLIAFVIKNRRIPSVNIIAFAISEHIVTFSMELENS
jgi:hypothetical protein